MNSFTKAETNPVKISPLNINTPSVAPSDIDFINGICSLPNTSRG